jgi:hypothetical protein
MQKNIDMKTDPNRAVACIRLVRELITGWESELEGPDMDDETYHWRLGIKMCIEELRSTLDKSFPTLNGCSNSAQLKI